MYNGWMILQLLDALNYKPKEPWHCYGNTFGSREQIIDLLKIMIDDYNIAENKTEYLRMLKRFVLSLQLNHTKIKNEDILDLMLKIDQLKAVDVNYVVIEPQQIDS